MTLLPTEIRPNRQSAPNIPAMQTTHRRHGGRRTFQAIRIAWLLCSLVAGLSLAAGASEDVDRERMQSLDEQVQEIKSDVLGIAAELRGLEERLLYPSNTQVAVFVSLEGANDFRLDSVEIQIDGEPVAHHIYSYKELEALRDGGVQRIYTGNVATGQHRIDVTVAGKNGDQDANATQSFTFEKEVEPKLVEITLAGGPSIQLGGR